MNERLKKKLINTLREYAESLVNDKRDILIKLEEMNDVENIFMIIDNYKELEPVLKKFFNNKANKEKWESKEENKYEK